MKSPKRILAAATAAYLVSFAAHADCVLPPAPSKIPDGATASEQSRHTSCRAKTPRENGRLLRSGFADEFAGKRAILSGVLAPRLLAVRHRDTRRKLLKGE